MANGDQLVVGPDGKKYHFPTGTTKDKAISYFKTKGIGSAPASVGAPIKVPPQSEPAALKPESNAPKEHESYFTDLSKASTQAMESIQRWRPRWDDPKQLLQDPTWSGRSAKYLGGEAIGAGKAVAGATFGGVKLLSDTMSALDPRELYQPTGKAQELGKEVGDLAHSITYDLPKATYDLIRHFPESSQDPEHLGSTLSNIAMTVDGGIKGAKSISEHLFPDNASLVKQGIADTTKLTNSQQATHAAYLAKQAPVKDAIKWRAVADTYVHNNGVDLAKDFVKADSEASKEVAVHTDNLSKIDSKVPAGVIDASEESKVITDAFVDIVKTPDPLNKSLNEMVQDAKATAPGQWTFEKARQFRSKIGAALSSIKGPQRAVASRVYADLTTKLKGAAKKYGLEDSWNQYNELEAKRQKSFPLIEKAKQIINENGEGAAFATALKNEPATAEVVKSLEKYGLDSKKTTQYQKNANEILRTRPTQNQRLTSYIYKIGPGTTPAIGAFIAAKEAASSMGMGPSSYVAALGAGALAGYSAVMLSEYLRAGRLSPQILDGLINSREWPGKLAPPKGEFPEGTAKPEVAGPEPPQLPESPKPVEQPSTQASSLPQPEAKTVPESISNKAKAAQVAKESKVEFKPQVTKVPEGEHGTGKIAEQAKARERVAKVRKVKGSTALGGGTQEITGGDAAGEVLKKAEAHVNSPHVDVSKMEPVDLEKQLQGLDKKKFQEAVAMRKQHQMTSEEYTEVLRFFYTEAMEDASSKAN